MVRHQSRAEFTPTPDPSKKRGEWIPKLVREAVTVTVLGSALYWNIDGRLSKVERDLEQHKSLDSHSNFVSDDRILHSGLHLAVEGEIRRHFAELHKVYDEILSRCVTEFQWQRLFDINPQLRNPEEHP